MRGVEFKSGFQPPAQPHFVIKYNAHAQAFVITNRVTPFDALVRSCVNIHIFPDFLNYCVSEGRP